MSLLTHMERWKDIEGFEGLYMVSTLGRVKSLNYRHTGKEEILKQRKNTNGYLQLYLCKDDKKKMFYVHRLVAKAFIPNPLNLPCVNHKDEKTINYCWCLEWCNHKYNNNYGAHNKRISESMLGVHINRKDISKRVICLETNQVYPSTMEAKRQTGINQSNISKCCKGELKTAGKFHWKYVD